MKRFYYNYQEVKEMVTSVKNENINFTLLEIRNELIERFDCKPLSFRYSLFNEWTEKAFLN